MWAGSASGISHRNAERTQYGRETRPSHRPTLSGRASRGLTAGDLPTIAVEPVLIVTAVVAADSSRRAERAADGLTGGWGLRPDEDLVRRSRRSRASGAGFCSCPDATRAARVGGPATSVLAGRGPVRASWGHNARVTASVPRRTYPRGERASATGSVLQFCAAFGHYVALTGRRFRWACPAAAPGQVHLLPLRRRKANVPTCTGTGSGSLDDESTTPEEEAAVQEALEAVARGETISLEELRAELDAERR